MIAVLAGTLLASSDCQLHATPPADAGGSSQVNSRVPADMLAQFSGSLQELASKVSPAVVQIEVIGFRPGEDDNRKDSVAPVMVRERTVGAGVIVDPDGYIITNAHVVTGAQRIRVILPAVPTSYFDVSGVHKVQVLEAKVIGSQPDMDLALLKVEASGLPALHFSLEHSPHPGELVFAIGSPQGLQDSITMGVISSAWRQPDPDNPMVYLQTDAPINPGNSGGPLVDVTGAVVGLNTLILSRSGGSEGIGFAIPARVVDFVYQNLRKYGRVHNIEIGAAAQTITPAMADGLGLVQNWGVLISDIEPGGPAYEAGITPGDIVVDVDGHDVLGLPGFAAALYLHPADRDVNITVLRDTQRLSLSVAPVLASDHMDQLAEAADPIKSHIQSLGVFAVDFDDQMRSLLPAVRLGKGVVVVGKEQEFTSIETGLRPGDIIHELNRTPVSSVEQLKSALSQLKPGDAAVLRIEREGHFQYLAFEME
jgi:serine protease Do